MRMLVKLAGRQDPDCGTTGKQASSPTVINFQALLHIVYQYHIKITPCKVVSCLRYSYFDFRGFSQFYFHSRLSYKN